MNEVFEMGGRRYWRSFVAKQESVSIPFVRKKRKMQLKEIKKKANQEYRERIAWQRFQENRGSFGKIYGYCGSCPFSRRTKEHIIRE